MNMNWLEQEITRAAYPATVPPAIKRLLAVKLQELHDKQSGEQQVLDNQHRTAPFISRDPVTQEEYFQVPAVFDSLPANVQDHIVAIGHFREQVRFHEEALAALRYSIYGDKRIYRNGTKEEVEAIKIKHAGERDALRAAHRAEQQQFWVIVRDLAAVQMKKIVASIPDGLRERIDGISKALPAGDGTVTAEMMGIGDGSEA